MVWLYVACLLSFVVGCFGLRFCCAGWFGGVFNDCVFWFGFIQVIVVLRWLVWACVGGFCGLFWVISCVSIWGLFVVSWWCAVCLLWVWCLRFVGVSVVVLCVYVSLWPLVWILMFVGDYCLHCC